MNPRTDERLLADLADAARRGPTAEELHKQRVSFIMSSVSKGSDITRARVEEILAKDEGRTSR